MSLTLEIPLPLIAEATKNLSLEEVDELERALKERRSSLVWGEKYREEQLLVLINSSALPRTEWERLQELDNLAREERLSEQQREELLRLAYKNEELGAQRLQLAGELARLRGISTRELIEKMGLFPHQ